MCVSHTTNHFLWVSVSADLLCSVLAPLSLRRAAHPWLLVNFCLAVQLTWLGHTGDSTGGYGHGVPLPSSPHTLFVSWHFLLPGSLFGREEWLFVSPSCVPFRLPPGIFTFSPSKTACVLIHLMMFAFSSLFRLGLV